MSDKTSRRSLIGLVIKVVVLFIAIMIGFATAAHAFGLDGPASDKVPVTEIGPSNDGYPVPVQTSSTISQRIGPDWIALALGPGTPCGTLYSPMPPVVPPMPDACAITWTKVL